LEPPAPPPPPDFSYAILRVIEYASELVKALDPNDKSGPAGFGPSQFIAADDIVPYHIEFENEAKATGPARRVVVTDQLDANLDWDTFAWTQVGFGDVVVTIPAGSRHFQTTVPMTQNGRTFQVEIELDLDPQTGLLTAVFDSIDPATSLPPDALTGFLPPEDGTGRGQGFLGYTVQPKAELPTGTLIRNVARIVFDANDPIDTNQVDPHDASKGTDPAKEAFNTLDAGPPTSNVEGLPHVEHSSSFTISWSGQDDPGGSGIASYDIYVAVDGGDPSLLIANTTDTSATFIGQPNHTYSFYSLATNNVGHVEDAPAVADASTRVVSLATTTTIQSSNLAPQYGDLLSFTATVTAASTQLGTPTGTIQFRVDGSDFGSPAKLDNGIATSDPITTLIAGSHTVSAVYSGDPTFTASTSDDLNQIVAKGHLTVMADNQSINHGDTVPALTFAISGFLNGDTAGVVLGAPDLSTSATSSSSAGRYPITVSVGSLRADNYDFPSLVDGTLTVHPKVVDVRLECGSRSISVIGLGRDLPFVNIKAIDVIFSDDVAVNLGALSLGGVNVPSYGFNGLRYNPTTNEATWGLPSALGVDRLMLSLNGATFAGDSSIAVNPLAVKFAVLPGDIDGDGAVSAADGVLARNRIGASYSVWFDGDGDGVIDINDFNDVRKRIG
jgi:hypothetical protein